jgi:hypothetical protein
MVGIGLDVAGLIILLLTMLHFGLQRYDKREATKKWPNGIELQEQFYKEAG